MSPSDQRLLRELVFKLAQLEQLATPEEHDAQLEYTTKIDPWLDSLVNRGLSHHTIRNYGSQLRHFLVRYPHPRRTNIDAFLVEATARGVKPASLTQVINALKSFFNYLCDVDVITTNPTSRVQQPHQPRSIRKVPTVDQVTVILREAKSPRHEAMLRLMVDDGLRVHELVTIRISNVDLINRLLTVTGKGGKQRQVPMSPATTSIIWHQMETVSSTGYHGDWLFPGQVAGAHVKTDSVRDFLQRLCRRLSIPKITPHQLRHYFATQMLSSGANLKVTAAILGHAQASTTADIYWHVIDQKELVEQHAKFSPLHAAHAAAQESLLPQTEPCEPAVV
jgi:integrase/recombinase XerD